MHHSDFEHDNAPFLNVSLQQTDDDLFAYNARCDYKFRIALWCGYPQDYSIKTINVKLPKSAISKSFCEKIGGHLDCYTNSERLRRTFKQISTM